MSHEHRQSTICTCYLLALEPKETCPSHGYGEWPPRCGTCGQFIAARNKEVEK